MADNETTLADEDGEFSDWIEIRNTEGAVNLDGWYLTDDADELTKWRVPAVTLDDGERRYNQSDTLLSPEMAAGPQELVEGFIRRRRSDRQLQRNLRTQWPTDAIRRQHAAL